MRSTPIVIITIFLSALGAALQYFCQATAFDLTADLPLTGAPGLTAICVFAMAVPLFALLVSLPLRGIRPQGEYSLYQAMGIPGRTVGILSGAAVIAGGLIQLAVELSPLLHSLQPELPACLVALMLAVGGGAMIALTLSGREEHLQVRHSLSPLLPGFAGCFWLILYYHSHSRDAVVLRYCWVLLCLMAAILAFYYQAGFAFDRERPLRAQTCSLAAAVYAFTALPAADSLSEGLLLLGIGGWMILHCRLIPHRSEIHGHREKL